MNAATVVKEAIEIAQVTLEKALIPINPGENLAALELTPPLFEAPSQNLTGIYEPTGLTATEPVEEGIYQLAAVDAPILGPFDPEVIPGTDQDPIRPNLNPDQSKTFQKRRYALFPPAFGVQATGPTDIHYATVTAQTRIEGAALAQAADPIELRDRAERDTIHRLHQQYAQIYTNAVGMPVDHHTAATVRYQFANAVTQTTANPWVFTHADPYTWRIVTNGTNTIHVPNGFQTINVRYENGTADDLRIIVDATIDNVYFAGLQAQNLEGAIRKRIKNNLLVKIAKKTTERKYITASSEVSLQELKARETLREMITESEYRRYLTNGFVMVKAASGLWYQIFNKQAGYHVVSYKDGKRFERLCIHTDSECPSTDHVINMKVLAEIDEEALRKGANISRVFDPTTHNNAVPGAVQWNVDGTLVGAQSKDESLLDVYRGLKPHLPTALKASLKAS